ncbi:alpha-L-rhamnosidase-related protein [Leeuwenhoekiella sp. W20_SRS_FM14]|uniref:alpha-L-rhamnosidase-related protein n=1 Tax=Leeuwenhoekiella sp. W20_SRS_FM14 TaxID=3240270 RepID=UPI003F9DF4D8
MSTNSFSKKSEQKIYECDAFSIYSDRVIQGQNIAVAESRKHLTSNYNSKANETYSRLLVFKFSINQKDNELPIGEDHWFIINSERELPVVTFGEPSPAKPKHCTNYLPANYEFTFKLDVSPVFEQFKKKGYYEAFDGSRIAKSDFNGFYLAGDSKPLTWDFVNLENRGLQMQPTSDPAIYSITVLLNPFNASKFERKDWHLKLDNDKKPQYESDQILVDTLYNLSLEEALKAIEPDKTLRTGAKWSGVWTRDVSYSILLAFAFHEPEISKISLRKKIKNKRIVQDTGSGGAWPVSSDRTTWVLAAWEIYKVTGDKKWLNEIYPVIKNTLDDDYKTLYNAETGLYSGESSFLDWREQTYPKWMSNADIYASQNLGTNAVHYRAHCIFIEIAKLKNKDFEVYERRAQGIKKGINTHLWLKFKGYYAHCLYGKNELMPAPFFEALGESLSVLFEIADQKKAKSIIAKSPLTPFGTTCIYPQLPGIPPYHNNGIWPFVQAYWNLAAAKTKNESVLNHGLASIYRASALFLSNYENMVAENGDFTGTEINSERMLWSIAGNLAMVYRVFLGIRFELDGIHFNPVVTEAYQGTRKLCNFNYRKAILNVTVSGFGSKIKKILLNGKKIPKAFIPAHATGAQHLNIELANIALSNQHINKVENHFCPPTVQTHRTTTGLQWNPVSDCSHYLIYKNGVFLKSTKKTKFDVPEELYANYQVSAYDKLKNEGFASEPIVFAKAEKIIQLENFAEKSELAYTNYSGDGFVEISHTTNRKIKVTVFMQKAGSYLLDFRYSNGSGPWNTDNKCAIRSLKVNKKFKGVMVFPQRGTEEWSDWGFSNSRIVNLNKGENVICLKFEKFNANMNGEVNKAMLDFMRLRALEYCD